MTVNHPLRPWGFDSLLTDVHKKPHRDQRRWLCLDCHTNTREIREHYFLNNSTWFSLHSAETGMLCIGCAEKRLGRQLAPEDFSGAFLNDPRRNQMSPRLLSRVRGQLL